MKHPLPIISNNTCIRDAIRLINRSDFTSAFIVSEQGVYLGELTNNDMRRFLISGANANDEISLYPLKYKHRIFEEELTNQNITKSVVEGMNLHGIEYIPVLNSKGEIKDTYSIEDISRESKEFSDGSLNRSKRLKILIVGGGGYLGSVLVIRLLERNYRVRVLDSFIYGKGSLKQVHANEKLEIIEGDLRDISTAIASLDDIDAVVLLAAIVGDPASKVRPSQTIETNILATQMIASACKYKYVNKFLYASTCSVYGVGSALLNEEAELNPISLYARTKAASEKAILEMGDDYFSPVILRMGTLYGYSPRMRFDLVVNTMTMHAFSEGKILVLGGKQWRPLLHVEDAADAFIKCLEAKIQDAGNEVFNVGSNEQNYQIDELAQIISTSLGGVTIERESSSLDVRDYKVSFGKIEEKLKFQVQHTIQDACRDIYLKLQSGVIRDPKQRIYYNHYFDSTEE